MNVFTFTRTQFSASILALVTIASLLLSALPAAFFVAEAAVQNVTIGVSMVPNPGSGGQETVTLTNSESFDVTVEQLAITDLAGNTLRVASDLLIPAGGQVILNVTDLNNDADTVTFAGTNVLPSPTPVVSYSGNPAVGQAVSGSFVITADDGLVPPPTPVIKSTETIVVEGNTFDVATVTGWLFNRDTSTASPFEFNEDEAILGNGALYVLPIGANPADKFIGELFLNQNINEIEDISYDYQLGTTVPSGKANEFYANAYMNFDNSGDFGHCVYNIVPTDGSAGWHTMTFDPTQDYSFRQRSSAPQTCPSSPADMGPNAVLRMFAINLGDTSANDTGVDGYFDNVVVDTVTKKTIFDFEPIVIPPAPTATVTMCKVDTQGNELSGWQLSLIGEQVGALNVIPNGTSQSITGVAAGDYVVKASGTYNYRTEPADAAFSLRRASENLPTTDGLWLPSSYWSAGYLGLQVNDVRNLWGTVFNPEHTYYTNHTQATAGNVNFRITDSGYGDNTGSLAVSLHEGATGVTAANGCVVLSNIPYGTYQAEEVLRTDWVNVSGLGSIEINQPEVTVTITNRDTTIVLPATLDITNPIEPDMVLSGEYTFTAEYVDNDPTIDTFQWAIRSETCNPSQGAVAGNVDGFSDPYTFTGTTFTTTFDVDTLKPGRYCLVVNPREQAGEPDLRATQWFVVEDDTKPFIEVLNPANGFIAYEDFQITVKATDNVGLGQVVVNLKDAEGNNLAPCLNVQAGGVTEFTASCTVDVDSLAPGIYGFRTNARDLSGTISNTVSQTFEVRRARVASLAILTPEAALQVLSGTYTFTANYQDADDNEDQVFWAIRTGRCSGPDKVGNAPASPFHPSTFSTSTGLFSTTVDMSDWQEGTYCLVVNPREDIGETDLRETRTFIVESPLLTCELASDTGTLIIENNDYAVETYTHPSWTALIPGAKWIWETFYVEEPTENTTRTFTETFTVSGVATATISVAADNGYQLFVNNQLVADRRAIENNFQTHTQKSFDIASYLVDGENTLRIEVTNKALANATKLQNPAGVLYKLTLKAETACEITTKPADDTPPTITVKPESVGEGTEFTNVSFKLYDNIAVDRLTLNGVAKDLTNNQWSDLNGVMPGVFGAVLGTNTLIVFDEAGNSTTFVFTLVSESTEGPGDTDPEPPTEEPPVDTPPTETPVVDNSNSNGGSSSGGTLVTSRLALAGPQQQVLGAATSQCGMLITDYLRMGIDNNPDQVRLLQLFLIGQGYFGVTVNGTFDAATDAAVRAFQEKYRADILDPWVTAGILQISNPTGWVYQLTRYKINNLICPGSEPMPDLI